MLPARDRTAKEIAGDEYCALADGYGKGCSPHSIDAAEGRADGVSDPSLRARAANHSRCWRPIRSTRRSTPRALALSVLLRRSGARLARSGPADLAAACRSTARWTHSAAQKGEVRLPDDTHGCRRYVVSRRVRCRAVKELASLGRLEFVNFSGAPTVRLPGRIQRGRATPRRGRASQRMRRASRRKVGRSDRRPSSWAIGGPRRPWPSPRAAPWQSALFVAALRASRQARYPHDSQNAVAAHDVTRRAAASMRIPTRSARGEDLQGTRAACHRRSNAVTRYARPPGGAPANRGLRTTGRGVSTRRQPVLEDPIPRIDGPTRVRVCSLHTACHRVTMCPVARPRRRIAVLHRCARRSFDALLTEVVGEFIAGAPPAIR